MAKQKSKPTTMAAAPEPARKRYQTCCDDYSSAPAILEFEGETDLQNALDDFSRRLAQIRAIAGIACTNYSDESELAKLHEAVHDIAVEMTAQLASLNERVMAKVDRAQHQAEIVNG